MNFDKVSPEKLVELRDKFGEYPMVKPDEMIHLGLYNGWDDFSTMKELTCINHPWSRYLTKNPWTRSIFTVQGPHGISAQLLEDNECNCPFQDLRVVVPAGSRFVRCSVTNDEKRQCYLDSEHTGDCEFVK